MLLPSLIYDFDSGRIEEITVGPRREVTLLISPLVWEGPNGRHAEVVAVRFGGIKNFAEVSAFLAAKPQEQSELAWLRFAKTPQSKPGRLFFELVFERIEACLIVECGSLQVDSRPST